MEQLDLGKHYLVEFSGCNRDLLDDEIALRSSLVAAVALSGAKIIKDIFHKFAPQGVTGVVVISESHVAIHTWPEYYYAAVDIFTCSSRMNVDFFIQEFRKATQAQDVFLVEATRGPNSAAKISRNP